MGIVDRERFKILANRLREGYEAQRVIPFGSAAPGEATEHSDLDRLVTSQTTNCLNVG